MSKAFFKKNMIVDTPFRYEVSNEDGTSPAIKKIEFKPANVTQLGDKVNAEDINGIQENSIYEVEAVRVVEGVNEFYDIAITGINDFNLFNAKLLIKFNETNTKVNPQLRILWNSLNKVYPIRFLNDFADIQVNIGDLKKEYIGYINQVSNKFLLWDLYGSSEKIFYFDTMQEAQNASWLVAGDMVKVLGYYTKGDDGHAEWKVSTGNEINGISKLITNGKYLNIVKNSYKSIRAIGWLPENNTADNYTLLRLFVENDLSYNSYKKVNTLSEIAYNIEAKIKFPIAFYGDSTTDGATTTDHVASYVGAINTYTSPVVMNISPNAYCAKLTQILKDITSSSNPVTIYNCGFDSMSFANGFGNKCFYRVFYGYNESLNNMDFSDVKAIFNCFGTSDSINIDITDVTTMYARNLEMFVLNCFERGVQPYLVDPVFHFQGVDSSENYRRNWQSMTIINKINEDIRNKYDLERLSLAKPMEDYVSNESSEDEDWKMILATDGVHPNDMGHRLIAGYLASELSARIKKAELNYKFKPRNPHTIILATENYDTVFPSVDTSNIITHTSFFKKYPLRNANDFLERLFIYCDKPMLLLYNKLSINKTKLSGSSSNNDIKVSIKSYTKNETFENYLNCDRNYSPVKVSGSHYEVIRLEVGLNRIDSYAPSYLTVPTDVVMGYYMLDDIFDDNESTKGASLEYRTKRNKFGELIKFVSSATTNIRTRDGEFKFYKEDYYSLPDTQTMKIVFTTSMLNKRKVRFCYNRNLKEYDTYNELIFEGTSCNAYVITNGVSTLLGTLTLTEDISLNTTDTAYSITIINSTTTGQSLYIQKITSSGTISNIGSKTDLGFTTGLLCDGYGFGVSKYFTGDSTAINFKNISVETIIPINVQL